MPNVKTHKRKSKKGKISRVKKHFRKKPKKIIMINDVMTDQFKAADVPIAVVEELNLWQSRALASRMNVPSGGITLAELHERLKEKIRTSQPSVEGEQDLGKAYNIAGGSQTNIGFSEKVGDDEIVVVIMDKDVEAMKNVRVERLGQFQYAINQETMLGEREVVMVTLSGDIDALEKKPRKTPRPAPLDSTGLPLGSITKKEFVQVGFMDSSDKLNNSAPVETIDGIGVRKGKALRKKGIKTVGDYREKEK